MDVVALAIGFIIGVVLVVLAMEIGMKKTNRDTPASKHTKEWDINEISNPRIMAEYLMEGVEIPKNSKVIVNQCKNKKALEGFDAKEHDGVRGNYIIGDDRALILAGPFKKDEIGIWTVEKEIVDKLNEEFEEKWSEATTMNVEEKKE